MCQLSTKIRTRTENDRISGLSVTKFKYDGIIVIHIQWRGESEAAREAARLMAPPPQSYVFASWSGTRVMS